MFILCCPKEDITFFASPKERNQRKEPLVKIKLLRRYKRSQTLVDFKYKFVKEFNAQASKFGGILRRCIR
jgi:hypothetical protein